METTCAEMTTETHNMDIPKGKILKPNSSSYSHYISLIHNYWLIGHSTSINPLST